ncbi:hypothetical protein NQ318_001859 [Aromia moschata]|uniref:Uncharacterized protein n=1 Tax=Aromia moschata TaxID=1265417 RepID=A0AAV8Z424_9CUCU|nr:hypothetical protein NQ318_001859 [Aromia moschata]
MLEFRPTRGTHHACLLPITLSQDSQKKNMICLKLITGEVELIEETKKEIFMALFLEMNFTKCREPTMCDCCSKSLHESFTFKASYMRVEDQIASFSLPKNGEAVELSEFYPSESVGKHDICRFCLQLTDKKASTPLDVLNEHVILAKGTMAAYFPEINLQATRSPVICEHCLKSLQTHMTFRTMCWEVEQKIKEFCNIKGVNEKNQVKLSEVVQFFRRITSNHHIEQTDSVKKEQMVENDPSFSPDIPNPYGTVKVKNEDTDIENQEFEVKKGDSETVLADSASLELANSFPSNTNTAKQFRCEICKYEHHQSHFLDRHMLTHKLYTCKFCVFETKQRFNLLRHLRTHVSSKTGPYDVVYKCEICTYESKERPDFDSHMIGHRDPKDTTYKCDHCTFEAKKRSNLERHAKTHKKVTGSRPFQITKEKYSLNRHLITHKDHSEITVYKCNVCPYEAKRKYHLKRHVAVHNGSSEVPEVSLYQCDHCNFKTKQKGTLKRHLKLHLSTKRPYKCELCSYDTGQKSYLARHMLLHSKTAEGKGYKCHLCTYMTNQRFNLRRHLKVHGNA